MQKYTNRIYVVYQFTLSRNMFSLHILITVGHQIAIEFEVVTG